MLSHDSKPMEGQEFAAKYFHLKASQEITLPTENENCEDALKTFAGLEKYHFLYSSPRNSW